MKPGGIWKRLAAGTELSNVLSKAAESPGDAYLFVGPHRTACINAALLFAASIQCPKSGCGECSVCSRSERELHPDVTVYRPEGLVYPVETIRGMASSARLTPMEGTRRVLIVDEADRIAERSQNALLKALEEPVASVTWVLTARSLDVFLPTVLSRLRVISFPPVPEKRAVEMVAETCNVTPDKAEALVRASGGDPEKASSLGTSNLAAAVRKLAYRAVTSPVAPRTAFELTAQLDELLSEARSDLEHDQSAQAAELAEVLGTGRSTSAARKRLADSHRRAIRRLELTFSIDFLTWLGLALRDAAAAAGGRGPVCVIDLAEADAIKRASSSRGLDIWVRLLDSVAHAQQAIVENANPKMQVESVLLAFAEGALNLQSAG